MNRASAAHIANLAALPVMPASLAARIATAKRRAADLRAEVTAIKAAAGCPVHLYLAEAEDRLDETTDFLDIAADRAPIN